MYREDVQGLIEKYSHDSRKYRRVHNSLQNLIMVGSASTTTIAALDTGQALTWQSITLLFISFAITVAAMINGYYKFRERSYFLQQTPTRSRKGRTPSPSGWATTRTSGQDRSRRPSPDSLSASGDTRTDAAEQKQLVRSSFSLQNEAVCSRGGVLCPTRMWVLPSPRKAEVGEESPARSPWKWSDLSRPGTRRGFTRSDRLRCPIPNV
ncbi:SLATT domain-containing protein [Streptomyces sp. NPDC059874]|uniref:SLATT domain-containing protein n=1 Tax=Streptomyces sp. NPDC059874 TaxID=3346983 RepID=UPI00365987E3